jgi:hypothetical protein
MANKEPDTEDLRAQAAFLLSQARAQHIDIQRAMAMAHGNPELQARLAAVSAQIAGVATELSNALSSPSFPLHSADLMALQSIVQSGEASSLISQAAAQAAGTSIGGTAATAAQIAEVKAASAETRTEVQALSHDLFDRKIFEPYLHFSSPEDEAEFRRHEEEAKRYIAEQLARRTPEGDLNASGGTLGYMLDANVHGAADSPDFLARWNALAVKAERQRAAMRAAGQSTDEYDHRLGESVRRFLKARGLSDAEIEKRLAGHANPLEVVKPFLRPDHAGRALEEKAQLLRHVEQAAPQPLARVEASDAAAPAPAPPTVILDSISAKLKSAGVKMTETAETVPAHGLAIAKPASKPGPGVAG